MDIEQVNFYGDVIETVRGGENVWISLRSVCEGLGINFATQARKILGDPKFSCCHMTTTGKDGKDYEMLCLPLGQLSGWLFSINANKVREHIKPRLIKYQQECMDVLYKHFMPRGEADLKPLLINLTNEFYSMKEQLFDMKAVGDTVFGDDKEEIQDLVKQVAAKYEVDGRTVWGWVRTECDIASYTKQNIKVKNFLKNKLGKGIHLVTESGN